MRTFISIELNEDIKNKINEAVREIANYNLPVKWVDKENIHITLKFLGEINENKMNELIELIKTEADKTKAFNITIEGLGAFPSVKKPRIIWVGASNGAANMSGIAQKLEENLPKNGFGKKEDKPFNPHITIGRVWDFSTLRPIRGSVQAVLSKFGSMNFGEMEVEYINIMKSTLTPKGPIYNVISKINFGHCRVNS